MAAHSRFFLPKLQNSVSSNPDPDISLNVPAVYGVLPARIRALRSILSERKAARAGKMWRSFGVGMGEAIDLAKT
jgi:hypothetical protein